MILNISLKLYRIVKKLRSDERKAKMLFLLYFPNHFYKYNHLWPCIKVFEEFDFMIYDHN